MISPLNGAPAFACNLPLGHPVLEVPPVVVGDFGDEGGDREEHEDGRDGHDDVEVVQDALFVVRRESLFQGRPFLLRQNTLPVKFMFHDALDVRSGFLTGGGQSCMSPLIYVIYNAEHILLITTIDPRPSKYVQGSQKSRPQVERILQLR